LFVPTGKPFTSAIRVSKSVSEKSVISFELALNEHYLILLCVLCCFCTLKLCSK
jgi:hypothetical protein